jgi:hypothetical protein
MSFGVMQQIMGVALRPQAQPQKHPTAFFKCLRLCGLDGSRASVDNTPQTKELLLEAASRRHKAAFAKVSIVTIVELGIHTIGAVVGPQEESEAVLGQPLWGQLPEKKPLADGPLSRGSQAVGAVASGWVIQRCHPTELLEVGFGKAFFLRQFIAADQSIRPQVDDGDFQVVFPGSYRAADVHARQAPGRYLRAVESDTLRPSLAGSA